MSLFWIMYGKIGFWVKDVIYLFVINLNGIIILLDIFEESLLFVNSK